METKITKKDVFWGYIAQFFNIGAGVLLLPFILKLLPQDILGVWYIFLMIGSFAQMLDFGFQPTFSRNVSYIFSGATRLKARGIDREAEQLDHPNYDLLKSIIQTMQRFYGLVSIAMGGILFSIGTWYVLYCTKEVSGQQEIIWAWHIYGISIILGFFYSYYNSLLIGRGFVKEFNQLTIITKIVYIVIAAIGLVAGYGLIAVATANLLSIVINRILATIFFYKKGLRNKIRHAGQLKINLLPIIWVNARKIGLGSIGGFFVQKGNLFFISMFLPLNVVAAFGLTTQIVNILSGVSPLYLNTHMPELYRHRISNNLTEIKRIFGESVFVYFILYGLGAIVILFAGNTILELFHSQTRLIPFLPLFLLLLVQFLEVNHSMAANLITTRNEIPYVKASLISGGCIGILSASSLAFTPLGIIGVILSTGIVQLCYNNWKWPLFVCQELQSNYYQFIKTGFLSLRAWYFRHF